MTELASFETAISHRKGSEKSSVTKSAPRPGRISGVGALVAKNWDVGVADGGNQTMVDVGTGVSVAGMGVLVARNASTAEQDVRNIIIARRANARPSNLVVNGGLLRAEEQERPRNDIRMGIL